MGPGATTDIDVGNSVITDGYQPSAIGSGDRARFGNVRAARSLVSGIRLLHARTAESSGASVLLFLSVLLLLSEIWIWIRVLRLSRVLRADDWVIVWVW